MSNIPEQPGDQNDDNHLQRIKILRQEMAASIAHRRRLQDEDHEPLMLTPPAEQAITALVKQIRRLVLHHNGVNLTQRIDQAQLEIHVPEYAMTQRYELSNE